MSDDFFDEIDGIVIDNGSEKMKCGWSGDDDPRFIEPTLVGKKKFNIKGMGYKEFYVGDDAYFKRGILSITHPVERGKIVNWEVMEKMWHDIFYDFLHVAVEERPIELILSSSNTITERSKAMEIMFESFNAPSTHITTDLLCSLLSSGRTEGTVLSSGYGVTTSASFFDGYKFSNSTVINDFGGYDLTTNLIKLLSENGFSLTGSCERELFDDIKEKMCYVSYDYFNETINSQNIPEKKYVLPDNQEILIGNIRHQCPECLFRLDYLNLEAIGIHEMIYNSITVCDYDIQKYLYNNIVLSGGNTMFTGIQERLKNEIQGLTSSSNIKIIAPPERKKSAWIGGSILSSLSTFKHIVTTRKMYDEYGAVQILNNNTI